VKPDATDHATPESAVDPERQDTAASAGALGRRDLLRRVSLVPLAAGVVLSAGRVQAAQQHAHRQAARTARGQAYTPKFFTAGEWAGVRVLADLIIPRDARSGSATDALVPEFIDFILDDPLAEVRERERLQTRVRGGLAWLERECVRRCGKGFVAASAEERASLVDDIAYPAKVRPELEPGAAFFTLFRDLVASGFWSSRMGTDDLRFMGNTFVAEWNGCPPEVLSKAGLDG
jgi:gluconate 2-dehydrogenase gamma chain